MAVSMSATFLKHQKRDPRSDFKRKRDEADDPREVNACPFGCEHADLDELGYCKHLIGFTNAPLPEGKIEKDPQPHMIEDILSDKPKGALQRRQVEAGRSQPLKVGDVLVRITSSSRVYRKTPPVEAKANKGNDAPPG